MATLPLHENAERLGRLRWMLLQVFEWAGARSRSVQPTVAGDARSFAEWSNVLAGYAEAVAERMPVVAGIDVDALTRPGPGDLGRAAELAGAEGIAALGAALTALADDVTAHRRLIDPVTDGPTARLLDLLAHDLERRPA